MTSRKCSPTSIWFCLGINRGNFETVVGFPGAKDYLATDYLATALPGLSQYLSALAANIDKAA
jgi:hypothetical protein